MNAQRGLIATSLVLSGFLACESGSDTSAGAGTATAADAGKGKELFGVSCATCHGLEADGVKGLGKSLRRNEFVNGSSDEAVVAMINEGRAAGHPQNTTGVLMPPKGGNPNLSDGDIASIVAYLRTLE